METNRFLLYDKEDNFYDVYIFEQPVDIQELRGLIGITKTITENWTMEDIEKAIFQNYPVKEHYKFDYILYNLAEVMEV